MVTKLKYNYKYYSNIIGLFLVDFPWVQLKHLFLQTGEVALVALLLLYYVA